MGKIIVETIIQKVVQINRDLEKLKKLKDLEESRKSFKIWLESQKEKIVRMKKRQYLRC